MATVSATNIRGLNPGYNNDNRETIHAEVPTCSSGDTVEVQLPDRWKGRGSILTALLISQFASAAEGARTRASVAVTSYSHVESTGVLSVVVGANITNPCRLVATLMPST